MRFTHSISLYSSVVFVMNITILCAPSIAAGNPIAFNDTALLNAVKTQWESATGLTLSDPPQDTELANPLFTRLDARNLGISDLTGLEACTALTDLNLGKNQLSDLAPLSGLISLVKLDVGLGGNPLEEDEEFSFWLSQGNAITDLSPLAGLVNLEYLSLMGNYTLTSIAALSTLDSLDFLWMGSSPIADFSPLLDTADTLTALGIFNCGMENADVPVINALTNLTMLGILVESGLTDISGLTGISQGLSFLALMDIGATDISVISNYTDLEALYLMSETMTSLPDLSGLVHLHTLLANESSFTDISGLSGLTSLQTLELTKNNISGIGPLETCTGLKNVDLSDNQITDIQPLLDNTGVGGFEELNIEDNPFFSGTPFCEENQLAQFIALAPSAQIQQNATCGVPVTLTITVTGMGSTSPGPGTHIVSLGETTDIVSMPISGSGWAFDHWAGDASGTQQSIRIFMDGAKTVEAVFVTPGDHILTVQHTGAGSGRTNFTPGVYSFLEGRETWIQAELDSGNYFGGWQGDVSGYMLGQLLIMDDDKTVTARFDTNGYHLTLNASGNGGIGYFQTGVTYGFVAGAVLDLHAVPQSGNVFDHWEGDIGGADPQTEDIQITMDQSRNITAVFTSVPQALLTVNVSGTGSGTTSLAPGVYSMDLGSSTWIQAIPHEGSAFDHWEGDIGSANPYQDSIFLPMDQDRTITAFFVPAVWTLTVQKTGNGATSPPPGNYGFVNGVQKWVYANLIDGGDAFDRWTGDLMPGMPVMSTVQELTMNQNRTVTAQFVPGDWTLTIATEGPAAGSCLPLYPGVGTYAYRNGRTAEIGVSSCPERFFAG